MLSVSETTPTSQLSSWHDTKLFKEKSLENNPNKNGSLSDDGYLRIVGRSKEDLNNSTVNEREVEAINDGKQKVPSQFAGVSLLAGKYLLFPATPKGPSAPGSTPKKEVICISIQTKEQYLCKVVPRNPKGLAMLAAYHRLEESSQHINQVIEAILTPKVIYFIMPKHHGNLHTYLLAKRNLDEAEAANIFKQMVEAVQMCHSRGVILRDIKMGRFVFMDKEKTIVRLESLEDAILLVDPGNDALCDKHGCPNYVSPEKAETLRNNNANNLKYPGKATDVWCLGVILFTMLVGRYPFNDTNYSKLLNKIRAGNFTIPPGMSSSVSSLIKVLLRKMPTERPQCSDILRSPWISRHCVPVPSHLPKETITKECTNVIQAPTVIPFNDQVVPGF